MTVLDKALVFGGEQLEGVDEAGVEELGGTEAGQEGGNVLLLRDSPNLYIMILGQPDRNTGCKMTPNMRCGSQVPLLTALIRPPHYPIFLSDVHCFN